MKLAQCDYTDISAGATDEGSFTLRASATAFYVLMSGIAKDKVGYPVREICTNAWDAAGGDFEVHLPTIWESTFKVRDYGPGLSHEQIRTVYTQLFNSTKNDSNESVGGLGLGCKSPFAYLITSDHLGAGAGSFMVRSFQQGTVRTYVMSIGNDGSPRWQLFATDPTSDRDGLEVSFAVRREDVHRFTDRATEILWSFEPRPKIVPEIEWDTPIVRRSGEGWIEYDNATVPFHNPNVRMGCVRYEIDLAALGLTYWPWRDCAILFDAPIGGLSVQASRESLAYDDRTIQTLRGLIDSFEQMQIDQAVELVGKEPSYLEACLAWHQEDLDHNVRNYLAPLVMYGGRPLKHRWQFHTGDDLIGTTTVIANTFQAKFPNRNRATKTYPEFDITELFRIDIFSLFKERIKILFETKPQRTAEKFAALGIHNGARVLWLRSADPGNIARVCDTFGLAESDIINLDTVPLPKRVLGPRGARKQVFVPARVWKTPFSTYKDVPITPVDATAGGVYAIVARTGGYRSRLRLISDFAGSASALSLNDAIREASRLGVLGDFTVTIITEAQRIKLLGRGNWVPAWEALIKLLESKIDFTQEVISDKSSFSIGYRWQELAAHIASCSKMPQDMRDAAAFFEQVTNGSASLMDRNSELYLLLKKIVGSDNIPVPAGIKDPKGEAMTKMDALSDKYPFLTSLLDGAYDNSHYGSEADREKAVEQLAIYLSAYEGTLP